LARETEREMETAGQVAPGMRSGMVALYLLARYWWTL
jgi:hypothetical protein